jgi:Predicted membrane-bound mannosyltransferase
MKRLVVTGLAFALMSTATPAMAAKAMDAGFVTLTGAVAQERPRPDPRAPQSPPSRPGSPGTGQSTPQVDVAEAVRRGTAGREGRFLGANVEGTTVIIRWEDPGGQVRDIRVQGRPSR